MELKCTNFNGEIVLKSTQKPLDLFFWNIVRMAFRNESYKLFFQEDALIAPKTRLSITFLQQIQMEWIKTFHVEKKYNLWEFKKKN